MSGNARVSKAVPVRPQGTRAKTRQRTQTPGPEVDDRLLKFRTITRLAAGNHCPLTITIFVREHYEIVAVAMAQHPTELSFVTCAEKDSEQAEEPASEWAEQASAEFRNLLPLSPGRKLISSAKSYDSS